MEVTTPPPSSSSIRPSIISPIARRSRSLGPVQDMTTQQVEEARRTSLARVLDVWSSLEERYAVPIGDDDEVDLLTGRIVHDRGVLRALTPREFGGHLEPDDGETDADDDLDEPEAESDDELGRWPGDEPQLKPAALARMRWLSDGAQDNPLDKDDLDAFLRRELDMHADDDVESLDHRPSATDDDDDDLDAPLPQIYESDEVHHSEEQDSSDDELLLVEDDLEPRPPSSPTPAPSPIKHARMRTPAQLYTPPRSQSIDSPAQRRASSSSPMKKPPPAPRVVSTPSSRSVTTTPSKPRSQIMEVVMPPRASTLSSSPMRPPSAKRKPLPSPSPSSSASADPLHIDFDQIRRDKSIPRTPTLRRTPAPTTAAASSTSTTPRRTPAPVARRTPSTPTASTPRPVASTPRKTAAQSTPRKTSAPVSTTPRTKGKGKARESVSPSPSRSPSPPPTSSPRKRKRTGDDHDDVQASPTKRRAAPVEDPPVAMPWPPSFALPAPGAPQQAFVAQFMAQVQHMNMLAQAMLPSFLAPGPPVAAHPLYATMQHHPIPPAPQHPPQRSQSADEREPERPRSRSALRTASSDRSGVRKRVSFLLRSADDEEERRGRERERVRLRGTPAPGREGAR